MKKTIIALVALSLIFGSLALAKEKEQERERISSPSEIKNFTDIIKRGKDLFGIREKVLEKINSLEELGNFEAVKKIGNSLWGIRRQDNQALVTPEMASCVKNAIDKKDSAIKSGISPVANGLSSLIDTRNTCQKAALDKTTVKEQREANQLCLKNYNKAIQDGKKTIKEAHKKIWDTYKADLKACKLSQEGSAEIKIDDGGIGLDL